MEDKLFASNQRDFWRSIGKIGIQNERTKFIPSAVVNEDWNIDTNKNHVLNRLRDDFKNLFTVDSNFAIPDEQEQRDISALNESITREDVTLAIISANK